MGRRGFPKAPAGVKLARGETRPSRVNYLEPTPVEGPLEMPRDMDDVAKATWRRVLAKMPIGVIYPIDLDLLRGYCEAVSRYVESARAYAASTPLVPGARGSARNPLLPTMVRNPLHQVVRDNLDQLRQMARELGIGPAARAGLQVEQAPPSLEDLDNLGLPPRLQVVGGNGR